jgi:ribosomal protein S18 acetylase RimI-like enzyme
MAVITKAAPFSSSITSHLRPLDIQRDLLAVADLIELCFASTMDADGEQYLLQMRRAAGDAGYLRWAPGITDRLSMPLAGYIWEEDGRLVGNLSLIPLIKQGERVYFIANVAVHPDYRRRGIARAMTEAALEFIRNHHISEAWLQVRADNPNASDLYLSEGFIERARRHTWLILPAKTDGLPTRPHALAIAGRNWSDWDLQRTWLTQNYPPEVAWNLPFNVNNLKPSLVADLVRFISGEAVHHWAVRQNGRLLGVLSFEPTFTSNDTLWLAASPATEEEVIRNLLPFVFHAMAPFRPLSLNYQAGRAEEAFKRVGLKIHQTLIWMEANLQ